MKYTVEITENKMVKTLIDNEGRKYTETWIKSDPDDIYNPESETIGEWIETQMEETDLFSEEFLETIELGDLDKIWQCIREES